MTSGNRCGHDPRAPRWRATHPPRAQPPLLHRARDNCRWFVDDRGRFPELRAQLRLVGRQYERRSERLEAVALVVSSMLWRCDLASLRVGMPSRAHRRRVDGLSLRTISKWTGMPLRRIDRAVRDLHEAGYLHCEQAAPGKRKTRRGYLLRSPQPVEQYGARLFRGLAAVRRMTPRLFERLGVGLWLERERERRGQAAARQLAGVTDLAEHRAAQNRAQVKGITRDLAAKLSTPGGGRDPRPPPE